MYPHLQRRKWLYTGYRPAQNGAALSVSTPSNAKDTTATGGTVTPVSQTKILSWSWFDPEENLLDGRLELTGITEEVQPSFTEIIEYLPTAIIARVVEGKDGEKVEDEEEKNLSITNWSCPEYVQDEEGRSESRLRSPCHSRQLIRPRISLSAICFIMEELYIIL